MVNEKMQEHLRLQYGNHDFLQIRVQTHQKCTIPQVDFTNWVLDLIDWQNVETVIDVGCGNGSYAPAVRQRGSRYLAGDLSYGMLAGLTIAGFDRINLDVHHLPFADATTDAVLANHMLYYVNLNAAPAEICRVLRPGGCLLAATNSENTMAELTELQGRVLQRLDRMDLTLPKQDTLPFTLESGERYLCQHFDQVSRHDLPSAFVFTEPQPLIDYISTMPERLTALTDAGITWPQIAAALHEELSERIRANGDFRVNKLTGVFVCRKKQTSQRPHTA